MRNAALVALLAFAAAPVSAKPSGLSSKNTADLSDRCGKERLYFDLSIGQWSMFDRVKDGDTDAKAIAIVLENYSPDSPSLSTYFWKTAGYYARRAELQSKFETAIFKLPAEKRDKGLRNYAYLLLYLGEFKKITEFFGPKGRGEMPEDGIVAFVLAQSYFRLGLYRESMPYTIKASVLMPEKVLDTRWQIMLTELGLYGDQLEKKYSHDYYDLRHIKTLFPNRDWNALPFEDVTDKQGIARWSGTGSVSFADLDGDGYDDLVMQYKGFPARIYRNNKGHFELIPDEQAPVKWCDQLYETVADFDNDGLPDLQRQCCGFNGPGPNSLLKNLGGFRFKDVTAEAKLDNHLSGMLNAWGDYDLDGRLDLLMTDHWGPVRLYHGNADGTFTDVTKKSGVITQGSPARGGPDEKDINEQELEQAGAIGCAFGDYDGDGYDDISCNGWNWTKLFHNKGDGTFTDVTLKAGLGDGKGVKGYNAMWVDYDNDGRLDLYTGRYVANSSAQGDFGPRCTCSNLLSEAGFSEREWKGAGTFFRNNGDGTFTDMVETTKFLPIGVMGVDAADWNNDGYADIVMGTGGPYMQQAEPYLFYEGSAGGTFTLKTPFTMGALWGKGHGAAFGDYDHDGNLDLYLNNGGALPGDNWPSLLLHNRGGSGNHWLEVKLKGGPGTNSMAVGAQVELWAGPLRQLQELAAGGRFGATNTFSLHFGLAKNAKVDRLVVRWPNRKKTVTNLKDVAADQAIEISEKDGSYKRLWGTAP